MASLTVRIAALVNIGNFQNVTVEYSLTDSQRADESINELKSRLQNKVESWVDEEVNHIKSQLND